MSVPVLVSVQVASHDPTTEVGPWYVLGSPPPPMFVVGFVGGTVRGTVVAPPRLDGWAIMGVAAVPCEGAGGAGAAVWACARVDLLSASSTTGAALVWPVLRCARDDVEPPGRHVEAGK